MATIKSRVEIVLRLFLIAVALFNALAPTLTASASLATKGGNFDQPIVQKGKSTSVDTFSRPSPKFTHRPEADLTVSQQALTPTPTVTPSTNAVTLCEMPGGYTYQVVSWPGYLQIKYSGPSGGDHHI